MPQISSSSAVVTCLVSEDHIAHNLILASLPENKWLDLAAGGPRPVSCNSTLVKYSKKLTVRLKSLSLFLPFLLASIVILHTFSCYAITIVLSMQVSVCTIKVHILQHNVGFPLRRRWAFRDGNFLAHTLCSLFLASVSVIFTFLCFSAAIPNPSFSSQCTAWEAGRTVVVIFLTDATQQPARAKMPPREEVRIIWT